MGAIREPGRRKEVVPTATVKSIDPNKVMDQDAIGLF
jgi:hypothetical protein